MGTAVKFLVLLILPVFCFAEVINELPVKEKIIALTFDACETSKASYLDQKITDYLIENKIPFTLFVNSKFLKRNRKEVAKLAIHDFVEIENHSKTHYQDMTKLSDKKIKNEVLEAEKDISDIAGRKSRFFRFPAGVYDKKTLNMVESLGYKVVHWTFPSGDPDKNITKNHLVSWVVRKSGKGSILIFHANGRGYKTGEALPEIVSKLKIMGYNFVKLEDYIR